VAPGDLERDPPAADGGDGVDDDARGGPECKCKSAYCARAKAEKCKRASLSGLGGEESARLKAKREREDGEKWPKKGKWFMK